MKSEFDYFGYRVDPERREIVYLTIDRSVAIPGVGRDLVSFDLRSAEEIDEAVEDLRRQLDAAAKGAKAALKKRSTKRKH